MKVFVSGTISKGGTLTEAEIRRNLVQFVEAENLLRGRGHEPIDVPWHKPDAEFIASESPERWLEYMREDIKLLAGADAIYMLSGWTASRGSRVEHDLAVALGLKVIYE